MLVTALKIYVVRCGNRRPIMVEIETDEGLSGLGEAGVAYGFGGLAAAEMIREIGQRVVLGRDPGHIEAIWNHVYDHAFWAKNGGAVLFSALSAIEQALWDIKGKAFGVPVYDLLGGPLLDKVRLYANGWWAGCVTPDDYARAAEATASEGYSALKLYPLGMADPVTVIRHPTRRRLERDAANAAVDRVAAIRRAVGADVDILLDFGGGLTTDESIRLCRRLADFDIGFIEEPVDPAIPEAYRKLGMHTDIPLAAGERAYTRYGFHKLLDTWAVGIVQPDVCNTGGILETRKIAAMAEVYNGRVAPHNYGGPLATFVSVQLAAMMPNFMIQEFFPAFRAEPGYVEILENPLEDDARNGHVALPGEPGIGARLNRKAVEPHLWGECRI